jgi:hypothetical protein
MKKTRWHRVPSTLSARLSTHVTLEAHATGQVIASFDGYSVSLGAFSAGLLAVVSVVSMVIGCASRLQAALDRANGERDAGMTLA